MNTAKQLISAFVDAPPLYWDRSYVQNMREIRGYPNWWRIRDDVAYIDGPPNEGEQYTRDLYVWSVEIVKDEDTGANTNKLELYDLDNTLEQRTEVVNGETVYYWKYREQEPELTYEHTDVIDSVSLEFDQLGRRLIAFESAGDVFLIWFDPVPGTVVVTNWGAGYNPQIITDTYRRTGGSSDSERFLFYVDNTTKQIVYRRQNDRYQTAYTLPSAPADVVELLKVSKNIYGGLTVLYCYESSGKLVTGSFTARPSQATVSFGTDNNIVDESNLSVTTGDIKSFLLKEAGVLLNISANAQMNISSGAISNFVLRENTVDTPAVDSASMVVQSGAVSNFVLESSIKNYNFEDSSTLSVTTGSITNLSLKEALINIDNKDIETASLTVTTASITSFQLG